MTPSDLRKALEQHAECIRHYLHLQIGAPSSKNLISAPEIALNNMRDELLSLLNTPPADPPSVERNGSAFHESDGPGVEQSEDDCSSHGESLQQEADTPNTTGTAGDRTAKVRDVGNVVNPPDLSSQGPLHRSPGPSDHNPPAAKVDAGVREIYFNYINYRGEPSHRRASPVSVRFGTSEYHTKPQWLMLAIDLAKNEQREFAMQDMTNITPADVMPLASHPLVSVEEIALGDMVHVNESCPFFHEWARTEMKVVGLHLAPDGTKFADVIEGEQRHRGSGQYDGETTDFDTRHLSLIHGTGAAK